jgi:hypothetical protein
MELTNGLLFCRIHSRLTGRRIVSLPFSDHCDPLLGGPGELAGLLAVLQSESPAEKWRYIDLRPLHPIDGSAGPFRVSEIYCFHRLDLRASLEDLFRNLHKDAMQRRIKHANREKLVCASGRTESLLKQFYSLLLMTRRRHKLPPPPQKWLENLVRCLGEALTIRVATKDMRPVAAMLTLSYNKTVIYKYGCSDARFHYLGGMPFLFWKTIEAAKQEGATELDLGRSDVDNTGLINFKDRLGAVRSTLAYLRFSQHSQRVASVGWKIRLAKRVFVFLPDCALVAAGKLLYRHIG